MKKKRSHQENVLARCVVDCEKMVIMHALIKAQGNPSAAARLLGTTVRVLTKKINKYGIDFEQFSHLREN